MTHQSVSKPQKDGTILGIHFTSKERVGLLDMVASYLKSGHQFFIVTPNPEIITKAQTDPQLRESLEAADISLPDGIGVVFAAKFLRQPQIKRVPGRVFMMDLIEYAKGHKLKIFFLGGEDTIIERAMTHIGKVYTGVQMKGSSGPMLDNNAAPISDQDSLIEGEVIDTINEYAPDILFVGFGAPKQEKWYYLHRNELKVGGAMVIGGSLDLLSGTLPVAPQIVSAVGLEWFWRLLTKPGHLPRVLVATISFPVLVILSRIKSKKILR